MSGRVNDDDGTLDLDDLTPTEAEVFGGAVAYYRRHFGFDFDWVIKLYDLGLDPDEVVAVALRQAVIENILRRA